MTVRPFGNGQIIGLSTDTKTAYPAGYRFFEEDTGDVHVSDGTYWWLMSIGPLSNKRLGHFPSGVTTAGDGMMINWTAPTGAGTQSFVITDTGNGRYILIISGTTLGNKGGFRMAASGMSIREWNPRTRFRIALGSTTLRRDYFGFASLNADLTGDDPLNGASGFMFGYLAATSANYLIMHNDGTGATVNIDTGIAASTATKIVSLVYDNANSRFSYSIDGGAYSHVTTELPAAGANLTMHMTLETNESGVAKSDRIYNAFVQSDK